MPRTPAIASERAFDFGDWHSAQTCKLECHPNQTGGLWIVCHTHHVAADMEAVSARVTYQASSQ